MSAAFDFLHGLTEKHLGQKQPAERQKDERQRHAVLHPMSERNRIVVVLFHETRKDAVRRRTDDGGHTADRGTIGNGKQHGDAEVFFFLIDRTAGFFSSH